MLIPCPECERKVSDRAKACPDCGFPVSEWVAERQAAERQAKARESRERVGEVDCPACDARGFRSWTEKGPDGESRSLFSWCIDCKHSGRVHQCRDSEGYYAVSHAALEAFLTGEIGVEAEGVTGLGESPAQGFRYEQAGELWDEPEGAASHAAEANIAVDDASADAGSSD
ncbi:zinc ribbon domain-containing protein [Pseudenhygromyxa sp. WMMC2535]|uniref:zinc ribbon domain-containing protein n=1 Tax=Pseudenhygromyxa sp. WMMC2535 TaxID=2712867 RepID=UPI0015564B0E|nr:zinc ribbon domain-containing protein [Pseudenhygromyxa sp. WMMC2535]NVB36604.1 zinc ribbon domain-containing protein [Pseudenhygromyxa sp. WMMC2535]